MSDQIRFRAIVNHGDATGDHDAGTSILVTIPDGLSDWDKAQYITGRVASEVSRYLAHECVASLNAGAESRRRLLAAVVGGEKL